MSSVTLAVAGATVSQGDRGEAGALVEQLLDGTHPSAMPTDH